MKNLGHPPESSYMIDFTYPDFPNVLYHDIVTCGQAVSLISSHLLPFHKPATLQISLHVSITTVLVETLQQVT